MDAVPSVALEPFCWCFWPGNSLPSTTWWPLVLLLGQHDDFLVVQLPFLPTQVFLVVLVLQLLHCTHKSPP